MAPFKRTHGFQELDSLKAADYSSQTALALSRGNCEHCGSVRPRGQALSWFEWRECHEWKSTANPNPQEASSEGKAAEASSEVGERASARAFRAGSEAAEDRWLADEVAQLSRRVISRRDLLCRGLDLLPQLDDAHDLPASTVWRPRGRRGVPTDRVPAHTDFFLLRE